MTLRARMSRRDEAVFVGREAELAFIDRLFVEDPPTSVVLLHGPGGIGKSGLLREVERRGALAGWTPHLIEGRKLVATPVGLKTIGICNADPGPALPSNEVEAIWIPGRDGEEEPPAGRGLRSAAVDRRCARDRG